MEDPVAVAIAVLGTNPLPPIVIYIILAALANFATNIIAFLIHGRRAEVLIDNVGEDLTRIDAAGVVNSSSSNRINFGSYVEVRIVDTVDIVTSVNCVTSV